MSVLVAVKVPGDVEVFRKALSERGEEFAAIADRARAQGALHHQFGLGEGCVLVVDEWETPEHFQAFFGDPALQQFIGSVGGDPTAPPEITMTESVDSPDRF